MKVVVIGCGGLGINIAKTLMNATIKEAMPDMDVLLVDGSNSNVDETDLDSTHFFKVPSVDGQGKKRGKNAKVYLDFVAENVARLPEADLYVLTYSLSGGSGSVLGPEFNRRLMAKGYNCVNVVLATDDSREDVKNTFNTLTGLANNVKMLKRPIHFMIEESSSGTRSEVDTMLRDHILNIATVCGVPHKGLDSNDVKSWLDYQQHDVVPSLTLIERFDDNQALMQLDGSVITILSLLIDQDNAVPKVGAVFNTDGVSSVNPCDVHFVTTTKNMDALRRKIEEEHKRYQAIAEGLNVRESFGSDDCEDNGMVF